MKPEVYLEDDPEFRFALFDGLTIGREADIDVSALPGSEFVSRIHATFLKDEDGWSIRDENSKNSTYINSVKVEPGVKKRLRHEDLITLGFMSFVFTGKKT